MTRNVPKLMAIFLPKYLTAYRSLLPSPEGDKIIAFQTDIPMQVFSSDDLLCQVFYWPRKNEKPTFGACWTQDENRIYVLTSDGLIAIYTPDKKLVDSIEVPAFHGDEIYLKYPTIDRYREVAGFKISPDGRYIYLNTINNQYIDTDVYLYDMNHRDSGWKKLGIGDVEKYSVGPDGVLAFTRVLGHYGIGEYRYYEYKYLNEKGIWVYDPQQQKAVRLTADNDADPKFSPDGKSILFSRMQTGVKDTLNSIYANVELLERK